MRTKTLVYFLILLLPGVNLYAYNVVEEIATSVAGYAIPIKICIPEKTNGKFPVHFFVHGGGWNGGTETEVPPAAFPGDANILCDELGIIYVGLAYRCKGNKGTFELAIRDLEASVKWFMERAEQYNADVNRIGFGGASAGTTLSAILAQNYPNCKLYIGNEGMYNVLDQDTTLSTFPSAKGKVEYGLSSPEQKISASPFYNLRENPAPALLLHGKDDWLCHYSQSVKYAEKIRQAGANAKVVLYEGINHTCLNIWYPEVFSNSLLEMAQFYAKEFQLKDVDLNAIQTKLTKVTEKFFPYATIPKEKLPGTWKSKKGAVVLIEKGKGYLLNANGVKTKDISYINKGSFVSILTEPGGGERQFYLRKNDSHLYELILEDSRFKSRRQDYTKQKN